MFDTMDEARNSLLSLVIKLKGYSLLLDHDDDTSVRIHDLVHDVAIDIASRDGQLLSVACGDEFKTWPKNSKYSKISTKSGSLVALSDAWECKKFEMFYLRCEDKYRSLRVPNSFFANMEELKVLGLRNVTINFTSLKFLKNLQTLCLEDCIVEEDIALVGELRKLGILSLVDTNIEQLTDEIGELSCLQLLDLTGSCSLNVIAPNVLSRLTRLEDLRIRHSTNGWEDEDEGERSNASLSELKHLSRLTALEIHIPDPDMLPEDLFSVKLERFHVLIGNAAYENERSMNTLALQFTTGDKLDEGLKTLVKKSEDLSFMGVDNANQIAQLLDGEAVGKVKHLYLGELDSTYITNSKVFVVRRRKGAKMSN
uniref:uncharacterized protein LOC101294399 n=1 Tax=Fragaria vesca subsp. vesca TaxID=101020 RepID=UPI0005CB5EA1|nr:PREDICTED: uncharacterized protein LOC101294399 [Fragaria vesca subsp. vesca]